LYIGYVVNSKEFSFYCPSFNPRIVKSINVKFLEDTELSGSAYLQMLELKKVRELTEAPSYEGCLIVLRENQIDYLEPQSLSKQPTHEEQV
jgi:hypothetical protein